MQHPQRVTRQRTIILEELRKVRSTHPTADEVYSLVRQRLPRISLGTVYRNLELLSEQGEIRKIETAGNSKRFDGDPHPHPHVRCRKCSRVANIIHPVSVPDMSHIILSDFTITDVRLEFDGLCDVCAG
jgi:Fur family ferric uptake transcriptional regulator